MTMEYNYDPFFVSTVTLRLDHPFIEDE